MTGQPSPSRARSRRLVWGLVAALASMPAPGRAGTMTGASTEWTQIANNVQLVLQYVQQIIDYAMQIQHLVELSKMTALFQDPRNTLTIMSMFSQLLAGLNQTIFGQEPRRAVASHASG